METGSGRRAENEMDEERVGERQHEPVELTLQLLENYFPPMFFFFFLLFFFLFFGTYFLSWILGSPGYS